MSADENGQMRRIGYWMPEKKLKKLNIGLFTQFCRRNGLELVELNLDEDLLLQGRFDLILHKLSDVWIQRERGDTLAMRRWENVQQLLNNSTAPLIDPIAPLRLLCDRYLQYSLVKKICILYAPHTLSTPPFVVLQSTAELGKLTRHGLHYPVICKPQVAHGSVKAHQMVLAFNDDGLRLIGDRMAGPLVIQQYLPHDALLYKVFIIGSRTYMLARPSLTNFYPDAARESIWFDTHTVSKEGCVNELTQMDISVDDVHPPRMEDVRRFVEGIQHETNLSMFGIDIVVEATTQNCFVIDVNIFPDISTLCCERKLQMGSVVPAAQCVTHPCDYTPLFFSPLLEHLQCQLAASQRVAVSQTPSPPCSPRKAHRSAGDLDKLDQLQPTTMAVVETSTVAQASAALKQLLLSSGDSGVGSSSASGSESDAKARKQQRISAPPGSFPSWNRIKRFYGIPKPQFSLGLATLPPPLAVRVAAPSRGGGKPTMVGGIDMSLRRSRSFSKRPPIETPAEESADCSEQKIRADTGP